MEHTHTPGAALTVAADGSITGPHAPYMLIVYALAEKIRSGELKPGDRVRSVTELVQTYNISPSTARRALARLKVMGLTDSVPGYATFVRSAGNGGPAEPVIAVRDPRPGRAAPARPR
jgi:DNA-binding GntR family transcriptional regulator